MNLFVDTSAVVQICGIPAQLQACEFCKIHELEEAIRLARELVRTSFRSADNLNLQMENDPDTGEEWLIIDFTLTGEIPHLLKEHEAFTQKWIESAPRDKQSLVRIGFNIL